MQSMPCPILYDWLAKAETDIAAELSSIRRDSPAHQFLFVEDEFLIQCRSPLPPLFMRFTIQTLNAAPRLKGFVLDILSSLVNKQVHHITLQV